MRLLLAAALLAAAPAAAQESSPLSDAELATMTGKFVLPNGVELALTVTSDTVVDGQPVLRTVLTVDGSARLQVFARGTGGAAGPATHAPVASGVTVIRDAAAPGDAATAARALGLVSVPAVAGGPALAVGDGAVAVQAVRGGALVSYAGDGLSVGNLVGPAVASAIANTVSDRTIDTVTAVQVDARNLQPYQVGAAQLRVEAVALDAVRRVVR